MRRVLTAVWVFLVVGMLAASAMLFVAGHNASSDTDTANGQAKSIRANRVKVAAASADLRVAEQRAHATNRRDAAVTRAAIRSITAVHRAFDRYDDRVTDTTDVQFDRTKLRNTAVDARSAGNTSLARSILRTQTPVQVARAQVRLAAQAKALAALDAAIRKLAAAAK